MNGSRHSPAAEFLVRAGRELADAGWAFTGFHWPVLASRLARRLALPGFIQVFEAGAACDADTARLPSSTTDYFAYADSTCFVGSTADVLLGLARRFDTVLLDAANVDVRGRLNATAVGPVARPDVRLPGGGGAADAAAAARRLVLLHGGADVTRVQRRVEHVTAAPSEAAEVRLLTRWGTLRLGPRPALLEIVPGPGFDAAVAHLASIGVRTEAARPATAAAPDELAAAWSVLEEAAAQGYAAAERALAERGRQTT